MFFFGRLLRETNVHNKYFWHDNTSDERLVHNTTHTHTSIAMNMLHDNTSDERLVHSRHTLALQ